MQKNINNYEIKKTLTRSQFETFSFILKDIFK